MEAKRETRMEAGPSSEKPIPAWERSMMMTALSAAVVQMKVAMEADRR